MKAVLLQENQDKKEVNLHLSDWTDFNQANKFVPNGLPW